MATPPIILVPGFWLGAWAWDEVAAALRADGHDVTALTLPASSRSTPTGPRSRSATTSTPSSMRSRPRGRPVVLAVHSGTGFPGYAATDRVPERIAAMVYVDSAPGEGGLDPDFEDIEKPLPPGGLAAKENLDGLTAEQIESSGAGPSPCRAPSLRWRGPHQRGASRRPHAP